MPVSVIAPPGCKHPGWQVRAQKAQRSVVRPLSRMVSLLAVTAATMATLVKVDMAALVVLAARAVFY